MPRSRGQEMPQKQSPRAPLHLKTTVCSEANGTHRSPRLDDRRSPRSSPFSDVQKKRGTRVSDLETKLGQAQEELKKLKEQLASVEAAKLDAQQQLEETKKLIPTGDVDPNEDPEEQKEEEENCVPLDHEETTQPTIEEEVSEPKLGSNHVEENAISDSPATDVFEVVAVTDAITPTEPIPEQGEDEGKEGSAVEESAEKEDAETKTMIEEEEHMTIPITADNPEVIELRSRLAEKDEQLKSLIAENESLMKQVAVAAAEAKVTEEELSLKLGCIEKELRESNAKAERLNEQLDAAEKAKEAIEMEMTRLRVQTSQWRKAAETAAAALTAGGEMEANSRRVSERYSHELGSRGFVGLGSPLMSEEEEGLGAGKRRVSGIRMFGDLWKKKNQHK